MVRVDRGRPQDPDETAVEVPPERLSPDALRALVIEFVTRDGTDYGARERSLESKVTEVLGLLARGEVRIVFDAKSGTANVVPRDRRS